MKAETDQDIMKDLEEDPQKEVHQQELSENASFFEDEFEDITEDLKQINLKLIITLIMIILSFFFLYRVIRAFSVKESKFFPKYYIPQPLTKTNSFSKMDLMNGIEVLYIEPQEEQNKIYIGGLISCISGSCQ